MHICGSRPLLVLLKVHTRPAGTWSHARARSSERLRPHRCDLAFVATPALLVATCKTAAAAAAAARAITALEAALQACLPSSPSWRALALIPESHQLATAAWPNLPQAAWRSASPLTRAQTWSWCTSTSPRPSSPAPTCSSLTPSTVSPSNTQLRLGDREQPLCPGCSASGLDDDDCCLPLDLRRHVGARGGGRGWQDRHHTQRRQPGGADLLGGHLPSRCARRCAFCNGALQLASMPNPRPIWRPADGPPKCSRGAQLCMEQVQQGF